MSQSCGIGSGEVQFIPHFLRSYPQIDTGWDKIDFSWPGSPFDAGLYRITIVNPDFRWIYIGESARINSRLWGYRRLYTSRPTSTSSRLSVLIRKALIRGEPVYLDTASVGKLILGNTERRLAMNQKAERQFAEAAAILQEEELAGEDTWVMNKILDPVGRLMWTSEWDPPKKPAAE